MANERMTADDRTAQLTQAGYHIAKTKGIKKVTRAAVARDTGVSTGLINRYFGDREGLRAAVLEKAVELKDAKTLAEASVLYELPTMPRTLAAEVKRLH
jgi:AcrR family transcriptional regulator